MPISNYDGNTFVAYTDISGFKNFMSDGRALEALNKFYNIGFRVLEEENNVEGVFVSDCGILIAKQNLSVTEKLNSLLNVVKKINEKMLDKEFMLTTSIAYGEFRYNNRIEFPGIDKTPIYGYAYVSAFLDNENGKPRLEPGKCRIIKNQLPQEAVDFLEVNPLIRKAPSHYYYYWNVQTSSEIDSFNKEYKNADNLKFIGMISALKKFKNT